MPLHIMQAQYLSQQVGNFSLLVIPSADSFSKVIGGTKTLITGQSQVFLVRLEVWQWLSFRFLFYASLFYLWILLHTFLNILGPSTGSNDPFGDSSNR